MTSETGLTFGEQLAKALGLQGRLIQRIVIDCSVKDIVKVYVQEFLTKDLVPKMLDILPPDRFEIVECQELSVDQGKVTAIPRVPQSGTPEGE
jgi:hypothetical protein